MNEQSDERRTVWIVIDDEGDSLAAFAAEADARAAVEAGYGYCATEFDWYEPGQAPVKITRVHIRAELDAGSGELITQHFDRRVSGTTPCGSLDRHPCARWSDWAHPRNAAQPPVVRVDRTFRGWEVSVQARTEEQARAMLADLVAQTRAEILDGAR